jgi:hypothetical protein
MDDWLRIPQDRKQPRPMRLAVLLGLTALLFLALAVR